MIMKYLEFSSVKYLSFSAPVSYHYDSVRNTLYEKLDDGTIYAYSPVFLGSWLLLMSDTSNFGFVTAGLKPSRARSIPSGLPSVVVPVPVIPMYRVNSSNINAIGYDAPNLKLYIEYKKGKVYEYDNVTPDIWNGLVNSESRGSYAHFFLKINSGTYPYRVYTGSSLYWTTSPAVPAGTAHNRGWMVGFSKEEE